MLWFWTRRSSFLTPPTGTAGQLDAKPKPVFHGASESDPLVTFAMQQRTLDRVKKLNGCAPDGEEWAKGCLRYTSKSGPPVVVYLHDEGHKYPEATPELIVKFFKDQAKK